jgi:hypothetical protein
LANSEKIERETEYWNWRWKTCWSPWQKTMTLPIEGRMNRSQRLLMRPLLHRRHAFDETPRERYDILAPAALTVADPRGRRRCQRARYDRGADEGDPDCPDQEVLLLLRADGAGVAPTSNPGQHDAGPNLLAHVLVSKFDDHLPFVSPAEIRSHGLTSPKARWSAAGGAENTPPLIERIEADIMASEISSMQRCIRDPVLDRPRDKPRIKQGRI